jgi:NADPH:quinone reductase-like Zn-dependent oxidoreductase
LRYFEAAQPSPGIRVTVVVPKAWDDNNPTLHQRLLLFNLGIKPLNQRPTLYSTFPSIHNTILTRHHTTQRKVNTIPITMKAVQILGEPSSPTIATNNEIEKPVPKDTEILVQVHAAGITGDEITWPEPYNRATRIPGHDISGIVSELGPNYNGPLKAGHEIFAMISADRGEGQAEYAICTGNEVALKPKSISHAEAAALPIPLLTAYEALLDHGGIKSGMRVFITGASGSVGILAVQIAKWKFGAHVVGLASAQHHETLRKMGADEVFDYKVEGWETQFEKVGLVFDTVGGKVLEKCWKVVEDNGTLITIGDPAPSWAFGQGVAPEAVDHPGVRYKHFILSPESERLSQLGEMIDGGLVKPLKVEVFPFDDSVKAWAYARQRGRGNKAVISFV